VATAKSYEFQVSTTAMFSKVVADKKTTSEGVDIVGLIRRLLWRVRAVDEKNASAIRAIPINSRW